MASIPLFQVFHDLGQDSSSGCGRRTNGRRMGSSEVVASRLALNGPPGQTDADFIPCLSHKKKFGRSLD